MIFHYTYVERGPDGLNHHLCSLCAYDVAEADDGPHFLNLGNCDARHVDGPRDEPEDCDCDVLPAPFAEWAERNAALFDDIGANNEYND